MFDTGDTSRLHDTRNTFLRKGTGDSYRLFVAENTYKMFDTGDNNILYGNGDTLELFGKLGILSDGLTHSNLEGRLTHEIHLD